MLDENGIVKEKCFLTYAKALILLECLLIGLTIYLYIYSTTNRPSFAFFAVTHMPAFFFMIFLFFLHWPPIPALIVAVLFQVLCNLFVLWLWFKFWRRYGPGIWRFLDH